jgi:hypothetical protein
MTTGPESKLPKLGGATATPGGVSQAATDAAKLFLPNAGTGGKKTGAVLSPSRGVDAQGNPIRVQIYPAGFEETYLNNLDPKKRAALQKQMKALKLYPENFSPLGDGTITQEDFNALIKLVAVGEQKGLGNIQDVIKLANKDSKIRTFLQTSGYTQQGREVNYTNASESKAVLTDRFLSLFNEKPSEAELKDFQTALKKKEVAAKGGISSLELNELVLSVANKRISGAVKGAKEGDVKALDVLDSGLLGKRVREIKAAYYDNGIPVSDATIYKQAGISLRDQDAYDNVLEEINNNAMMQWGKLGLDLKPGQTVRTKLQPYITTRAKIRGLQEDDINIADMTDILKPDGSVKTYKEFKLEEYGSKEYLDSDNYKQTVLNDTQAVFRNFGIM